MTYELAKQLKDAGFPQTITPLDTYSDGKDGEVLIPTLSELIFACADKFDNLRRIYSGEWVAERIGKEPQLGKTPEEAVANLWLTLNRPGKE